MVEGLLKMNGQELFKENIEEFGIWDQDTHYYI